jgi:hypothetical protein
MWLAEVSWVSKRVRFRLLEIADDGVVVELAGGEVRTVQPQQVRRYRPLAGEWIAGDFVVKLGVDETAWRAVVREVDGLELVVDTSDGELERLFIDEVESPWDRDLRDSSGFRSKPGPPAQDVTAERINTAAARRDRALRPADEDAG